ncbi:GRIP and coiled-coil domain-containing protein 2-like [Dermacentor albipictus]|uniref:GRIP and coiled-coil domain-containing protein 2-like n=1 Tax=Dermacentor albipictus TaxID=60249 RepID=UPI0038FC29E3
MELKEKYADLSDKYQVRVHSVPKQQKEDAAGTYRKELSDAQKFQATIKQMEKRMNELQAQLVSQAEAKASLDEYDQFVTLRRGNKKQRLVPVLTTMLKPSPEEKKDLEAVVADEMQQDAPAASGWACQLPQ